MMNPESLTRNILWAFCLFLPMKAICSDAWTIDRTGLSNRYGFGSIKARARSRLILPHSANVRYNSVRLHGSSAENASTEESSNSAKMSELNDMDVVIYSLLEDDDDMLCLGAVQEGGLLSPLSAWTVRTTIHLHTRLLSCYIYISL